MGKMRQKQETASNFSTHDSQNCVELGGKKKDHQEAWDNRTKLCEMQDPIETCEVKHVLLLLLINHIRAPVAAILSQCPQFAICAAPQESDWGTAAGCHLLQSQPPAKLSKTNSQKHLAENTTSN